MTKNALGQKENDMVKIFGADEKSRD